MTKAIIMKLIMLYSAEYGIDPRLALSIAETESSFNQKAIGLHNERGLFQILPAYSVHSENELSQDIHLNIKEGLKKLKEAQLRCKHQEDFQWVVCYNLGMTGGSRIKYPALWPYYKKVRSKFEKYNQFMIAHN